MSESPKEGTIKLVVEGIGNVPSFKNNKMVITRPKPRLITNPKNQQWMDQCTDHIESALRCWLAMNGTVTGTGCIPLSKIVSLLPLDDSLKWIGSHSVSWRRVKKGEEGFEITIEPI